MGGGQVKSSDTSIVLFLDEIHTLIGAGKTDGAMDAGNLLKPMLARGELRCIGATTLDEYQKYMGKGPCPWSVASSRCAPRSFAASTGGPEPEAAAAQRGSSRALSRGM